MSRAQGYRGEHSFPLILQNVHRFFMWVAIVFIAFLAYDVWLAMWFTDPATGLKHFGIGVGTIILATNVVLLASYTWGCHVLRHVVGGRMDEVSKSPVCDMAYACVERPERPPPAVRVVQPLLGDVLGPLRAALLDGRASPT